MKDGLRSRYVHDEGVTAFCYSRDGKHIITCGHDCDLRRWDWNLEEDDKNFSSTLREGGTCIVTTDNMVYVGSGYYVEGYSYPELIYTVRPLRFIGEVTCLDVSPDMEILAAGACDMKIKLKNLTTNAVIEILGHTAPVLSIVFNHNGSFLASSSGDGSVKVWDTSTIKTVKTFEKIVPTENDFFTAQFFGTPVWCKIPKDSLALINQKSVYFYCIKEWTVTLKLTCNDIKRNISVISISRDQTLLSAGTSIGEVIVWSIKSQKVLTYHQDYQMATIISMKWNPHNRDICCSNRLGRVYIVPNKDGNIQDDEDKTKEEAKNGLRETDDGDGANVVSIREIKAPTPITEDKIKGSPEEIKMKEDKIKISPEEIKMKEDKIKTPPEEIKMKEDKIKTPPEEIKIKEDKIKISPEEIKMKEDNPSVISVGEIRAPTPIPDVKDDEDGDNVISISEIKASTLITEVKSVDGENDSDNDNEFDGSEIGNRNQAPIKTDFQPAFQPASSPSYFERGYMVWNSVGVVLHFNAEEESSIDVEFHDAMLHHTIHRRNTEEFTMAALSCKVLCLASSSKLTCLQINGWDEKKEWSLKMPDEESITAVAASGNWVCCGTNLSQLRFFICTGMQRQIVSVPGSVVCMNGHERLLIVVTNMGIGIPGCQNLSYRIYEITDFFIKPLTPFQPLPLTPETQLKWLGFTGEGTPCTYDSAGILRLSRDFLSWEVVCNVRQHCKNKSDNYFLIGVSERTQSARCTLCKGSWYPMTLPRPTVVEIPFKIPLCETEEERITNEDLFWRSVFSLPALVEPSNEHEGYKMALKNFEKDLKQSVIKLFADAHRHKNDMRAVSIASLMSEWPLRMALKLVQGEGRYLFDKLHNIEPKDWSELRKGPMGDVNPAKYVGLVSEANENNQRNEISASYSNKSQGDMFELSQPSPSNGSVLLAATRDKESPKEDQSNSCNSANGGFVNPFKSHNKDDQGPKGLSFFNTVKQSNLKPAKPDAANTEKGLKGKKANTPKEKPSGSQEKMKFFEWFNSQKSALQENYPDMSLSELTRAAMKVYREEVNGGKQKRGNEGVENDEGGEESQESKRLKMEDEKAKVKASAADKLSAFNFFK